MSVLAKIALGPILLAQGAYVRRFTPRLSEPVGDRSGVRGAGPALRLLVAGDSAAAGVGAASQAEALSGQLVSLLAEYFRVSWRLLARSGDDTGQILTMLEHSPAEHFDVAVISIGVNDVTGRGSGGDWIGALDRLIDLLKQKFGVRRVVVSQLPPMHHFPALPQPLRAYLGARAKRFNVLLTKLAKRRGDFQVLPLEFPLRKDWMAVDGFHPGPPIYSIWAKAAAELIRVPVLN